MTLLLEYWKPVFGFENHYQVSNLGRVCRTKAGLGTKPGKEIKSALNHNGYQQVPLCVDGKSCRRRVHLLVAETFLGQKPLGLQVNHKDGCKFNNRAGNLEYVTPRENIMHAIRLGLASPPPQTGRCIRIDRSKMEYILAEPKTKSIATISREIGVSTGYVCEIRSGKRNPRLEERC